MNARVEGLRASCLCGGVAFVVTAPLLGMGNCHCSMCRRQHGTAFSTYVQVDRAGLEMCRGQELIESFRSSESATRKFCGTCGSKLFYLTDASPEFIWIAAGVFYDCLGIASSYHIFTASKASWYEITDDLPQHAAFPGDAGT